ncbi:MAG: hypothetical protein LBP99_05330 [Azoarcus sp.]|jgi:hypothetical protein|nr:hypothetical protein [Azoarcus sp.]
MTEYIIIVMLMAIGSIFVYTQFGDVLRNQTAAGAKALAGQDGSIQTAAAREAADAAATGTSRNIGNAGSSGSYDVSPSPSDAPPPGTPSPDTPLPPASPDGSPGDDAPDGVSATPPGSPVVTPDSPSSPLDNPAILEIIAQSPTLQSALAGLKADEWQIIYDPSIHGAGNTDRREKIIRINSRYQDVPLAVVGILAHETGHALDPREEDWSSEAAFVQSRLLREGEATLYNIKIQREIADAFGTTIALTGKAANRAFYNEMYDKVENGEITHEAAVQQIADRYRTSETAGGKTYVQRSTEYYNANKHKHPTPP